MIDSPTFNKGESLGDVEIRYFPILPYLNALVSYTEFESGTIVLSSLGAFLIFVMNPKLFNYIEKLFGNKVLNNS